MALHERALEEGAAVTVASYVDGELVVRREHVYGHTRDGRLKIQIGNTSTYPRYADEGTWWIRGHWRKGTSAADALLAAVQLARMIDVA